MIDNLMRSNKQRPENDIELQKEIKTTSTTENSDKGSSKNSTHDVPVVEKKEEPKCKICGRCELVNLDIEK